MHRGVQNLEVKQMVLHSSSLNMFLVSVLNSRLWNNLLTILRSLQDITLVSVFETVALHFSSLNMMLSVSVTPDFGTIFSQLSGRRKALLWYQFVGIKFY